MLKFPALEKKRIANYEEAEHCIVLLQEFFPDFPEF
jgi:hypothetical protein